VFLLLLLAGALAIAEVAETTNKMVNTMLNEIFNKAALNVQSGNALADAATGFGRNILVMVR